MKLEHLENNKCHSLKLIAEYSIYLKMLYGFHLAPRRVEDSPQDKKEQYQYRKLDHSPHLPADHRHCDQSKIFKSADENIHLGLVCTV